MPLGLPSILKTDGTDLSEEEIFSILQRDAKAGHLAWDPAVRFLAWALFLGVIQKGGERGSLEWDVSLKAQRQRYLELKVRHMPDLFKVAANVDPLLGPSSQNEGGTSNPWETYYESNELLSQIRVDLDRLFLTGTLIPEDYFQEASKRQRIQTILFVYAQEYPNTSYKQGMHEVLAFIAVVVELSRTPIERLEGDEPVHQLERDFFDREAIEADSYCLFERIMQPLEVLYGPGGVASCDRMQYDLLGRLDGQLKAHLDECRVTPQIYGLRWLRLLYTREFPSQEVLLIWDSVFALSSVNNSSDLVKQLEYVGLAMLMMGRVDLLNGSEVEVLQILMRYTLKGKVGDLVELSHNLQDLPSPTAVSSPSHKKHTESSSSATGVEWSPIFPLKEKDKSSNKAPAWMLGDSRRNQDTHFDHSNYSSDAENEQNRPKLPLFSQHMGEKLKEVGNSVQHAVGSLGQAAQRVYDQIPLPNAPRSGLNNSPALSYADTKELATTLEDALSLLSTGLYDLATSEALPSEVTRAVGMIKNVSSALNTAAESSRASSQNNLHLRSRESSRASLRQVRSEVNLGKEHKLVANDIFSQDRHSSNRGSSSQHHSSNVLNLFAELEDTSSLVSSHDPKVMNSAIKGTTNGKPRLKDSILFASSNNTSTTADDLFASYDGSPTSVEQSSASTKK
mmetsp:Transcript_17074/g.22218  ORF Transcript_17074/g.22218 Transcript_17074/m.22218 type:complete len:679 (+) Transcript_17074:61-2097(+)